jgi:hypothetical protein
MRNAKWLVGALGLVIVTAGCTNDGYYPGTAYNSGYTGSYYNSGYNNGYYAPSTAYAYPSTAYVASAPRSSNRYWNSARRDSDGDGIPNRYDRDANGDGVPDRYQGRYVRY